MCFYYSADDDTPAYRGSWAMQRLINRYKHQKEKGVLRYESHEDLGECDIDALISMAEFDYRLALRRERMSIVAPVVFALGVFAVLVWVM